MTAPIPEQTRHAEQSAAAMRAAHERSRKAMIEAHQRAAEAMRKQEEI